MTCDYWDSILPNEQFFIIGTTHEFVLFDKGKSVYRTQVLSVLHHLLPGTQVELEDLLGVGAAEEDMRVMLRRMELQSHRNPL